MANTIPSAIRPPRIWHLLLWMFWSAAYLALDRMESQSLAVESTIENPVVRAAFTAARSLFAGGAITGLILVPGNWLWQSVYMAPGHWLLLGTGVSVLIVEIGTALEVFGYAEIGREYDHWFGWRTGLLALSCTATIFSLAVVNTTSRYWRLYFVLLAGFMFVVSFWGLALMGGSRFGIVYLTSASRAALLCEALGLMLVAIVDCLWRIRRDWLHWFGAVLTLGLALMAISLWFT